MNESIFWLVARLGVLAFLLLLRYLLPFLLIFIGGWLTITGVALSLGYGISIDTVILFLIGTGLVYIGFIQLWRNGKQIESEVMKHEVEGEGGEKSRIEGRE